MLQVIKADKTKEPFDENKVLQSIRRAGIPEDIQLQVLSDIKNNIYDNIPTHEIYAKVLDSLGSSIHPYAKGKYTLKEAIMMLGPTGYPFEDFVSKLLNEIGYQTRVRQTVWGKCVSHEIDVIAEKDDRISMIETKFHNNLGTRSEVQTALYTYARFLDVKEKCNFSDAWIVTNTKTTQDANTYAQCMGMKVISWSYPRSGSLRELIETTKLHPITMLTTLSSSAKMDLLKEHVVMCKDLRSNLSYLDTYISVNEEKEKVIQELDFICN